MKYFVFDNGVELIITSDKTLTNGDADICSCVGEIKGAFCEYVSDFLDDRKIYEFEFENNENFKGTLSECIAYCADKRTKQ